MFNGYIILCGTEEARVSLLCEILYEVKEAAAPFNYLILFLPATPANEPYVEPLRYQKGQSRTPSQPVQEQSDVDKIVSAYGVGPTDENGIPLFGLRALKKKSTPASRPLGKNWDIFNMGLL